MGERKRDIVTSSLLTTQENDQLKNLVGADCLITSSADVQVYYALPPNRNMWTKQFVGVAAFIKDFNKRSYFIRVFDIKAGLLMEKELNEDFQYQKTCSYFHTFETEECQAALNFANEKEAESFWSAYANWRDRFAKKSGNRVRVNSTDKQQAPAAPSQLYINDKPMLGTPPLARTSNLGASSSVSSLNERNMQDQGGNDEGRQKTAKEDIGRPMNFRHISHIGWDPENGFSFEYTPRSSSGGSAAVARGGSIIAALPMALASLRKQLQGSARSHSESSNAVQLRDRLTCKICMDSQICIAFQPCGHQCSCDECAASLS